MLEQVLKLIQEKRCIKNPDESILQFVRRFGKKVDEAIVESDRYTCTVTLYELTVQDVTAYVIETEVCPEGGASTVRLCFSTDRDLALLEFILTSNYEYCDDLA